MKIETTGDRTTLEMGQFKLDLYVYTDPKYDSIELEIDVPGYGGYSSSHVLYDEEIDQFIDTLIAFRNKRNTNR